MPGNPTRLAAVLVAALLLPACIAVRGTARPVALEELRDADGWLLVGGVPFVPQAGEQDCGAACLAMVLRHGGVEVEAEELRRECVVEGEEGLRASALRDAARRRGLAAFTVEGSVEDLRHELRRGRPVVVGLVKTRGPVALAHYAVVVGLNEAGGRVAALDPASGPVVDSLEAFQREWAAARSVTLVVLRSGAAVAARAAGP
jgi:ABC-type bacteriocin/lantibiotic exporter with double-glycine peptidase domain